MTMSDGPNMAPWENMVQDGVELYSKLVAFHDAWVEHEVARSTGNPDLAKDRRQRVIEAHKAVRQTEAACGRAAGSDVLPCPFCGRSAAVWPDEVGSGGQHVAPYHAGCRDCRIAFTGEEPEHAIKEWNRRHPIATIQGPLPMTGEREKEHPDE